MLSRDEKNFRLRPLFSSLKTFSQIEQYGENKINLFRFLMIVGTLLFLFGCSTAEKKDHDLDAGPTEPVDWTQVKPVIPKYEPKSAYGNPETYEVYGVTYRVLESSEKFRQKGVASWYGSKFHGRRTSSGETYDMLKLTAAHKTLPIPCYVRVKNLDNGRELVVKVNDRGPFVKSRIIDLSYAAAHKLGMTEEGTANVIIETIDVASTTDRSGDRVTSANHFSYSSSKSSKSNGQFRYVQVGAYSNHKSAQKLAKVLDREIKLPVTISSIKRKGKKLYRVRIGPIHSLSLAQELADTLNISELGKPTIVYQD